MPTHVCHVNRAVMQDITPGVQRGQCVLHVAASYGYPALVKTILQLKANVDCRDEVWSALHNGFLTGTISSLFQPAALYPAEAGHTAGLVPTLPKLYVRMCCMATS